MRRKTNGRKSKKTGIYDDISNQRRWNCALRFETFDLPPYGKESSCNFKNILEGYVSTKTGYRLPNVHTLHNQVHIVVGGTMGDVPSASNDSIFPLHHSFVDCNRLRNGFASSARALRFLEHTMHASDTTKMTSLHHFILCILINGCLRSLSSSVLTSTMSTRMVSTHEVSTWPWFIFPLPWMRFCVIVM